MDELSLSPEVLDATADIIEGYCYKQIAVMDNYLNSVSAMRSEWTDDRSIGPMLEEIRRMKSEVEQLMDEIRSRYPSYFRAKADIIRNRPTF